MARIENNRLLHPTKRIIETWKSDFRTSDGPNTSTFISLLDLGIPYDSHYRSRIILPAGSEDFFLNYGTLKNVTFLLIKVTYNGNYDYAMEDGYDSLYNQEPNNYNITYYYEGNSGVTYPIGRLLLLSGSINNKLTKIYLNNPLDYDVVLDVLQADILQPSVIPPSTDIIATNLYYGDIITDNVYCSGVTTTTTTTTTVSPTTTTTTTILNKDLMIITLTTGYTGLTYSGEYYTGITYIYTATGDTIGLFDYYYNNQWYYAGESSNFLFFTNLSVITLIRFYFDLNDSYYGTLKTNLIEPLIHNNGLYFVDVDIYGTPIIISGTTSGTTSGVTSGSTSGDSTEFIITSLVSFSTGYTINQYFIPYDNIISIELSGNSIYLYTNTIKYILKFLTVYDLNMAYYRMTFVYNSHLIHNCVYLTVDNIFENGIIV